MKVSVGIKHMNPATRSASVCRARLSYNGPHKMPMNYPTLGICGFRVLRPYHHHTIANWCMKNGKLQSREMTTKWKNLLMVLASEKRVAEDTFYRDCWNKRWKLWRGRRELLKLVCLHGNRPSLWLMVDCTLWRTLAAHPQANIRPRVVRVVIVSLPKPKHAAIGAPSFRSLPIGEKCLSMPSQGFYRHVLEETQQLPLRKKPSLGRNSVWKSRHNAFEEPQSLS